MIDREALASKRYHLLIEQLGAESGNAWGWKSQAARQLGVAPAYVNQIVAGKKSRAGASAIARAIENLDLHERFFFDDSLGDAPNYRDHRRGPTEQDLWGPHRPVSPTVARLWRKARELAVQIEDALRANDEDAVLALTGALVSTLETSSVFRYYADAVRALDALDVRDGLQARERLRAVAQGLASATKIEALETIGRNPGSDS